MITRNHINLRSGIKYTWPNMRFVAAGILLVVVLHGTIGTINLQISTPLAILGTALSILLGFRNNNAYDRWWEARQLWGRLVNNSRNLNARMLSLTGTYWNQGDLQELKALQKSIIYRHIAFVHALKHHLREQEPWESLQPFLSELDLRRLQGQHNVPNAILLQQQLALRQVVEQGYTDSFYHVQLDNQMAEFYDIQGGCERIKNTVFPRQYTLYTQWAVRTFLFLLPISMYDHFDIGWLAILFSLLIGFVFAGLEYVGNLIENPFDNLPNDTPMSSLARTIEINLRQNLDETELPQPVQPVNGILY